MQRAIHVTELGDLERIIGTERPDSFTLSAQQPEPRLGIADYLEGLIKLLKDNASFWIKTASAGYLAAGALTAGGIYAVSSIGEPAGYVIGGFAAIGALFSGLFGLVTHKISANNGHKFLEEQMGWARDADEKGYMLANQLGQELVPSLVGGVWHLTDSNPGSYYDPNIPHSANRVNENTWAYYALVPRSRAPEMRCVERLAELRDYVGQPVIVKAGITSAPGMEEAAIHIPVGLDIEGTVMGIFGFKGTVSGELHGRVLPSLEFRISDGQSSMHAVFGYYSPGKGMQIPPHVMRTANPAVIAGSPPASANQLIHFVREMQGRGHTAYLIGTMDAAGVFHADAIGNAATREVCYVSVGQPQIPMPKQLQLAAPNNPG